MKGWGCIALGFQSPTLREKPERGKITIHNQKGDTLSTDIATL